MNLKSTEWRQIFKLAKQTCRENKLKEFHYKLLHRIIVTKKELCRFGVKQDGNCEEELPKKPVGQLSATVGRQLTNRLPTVYRQLTNRLPTG